MKLILLTSLFLINMASCTKNEEKPMEIRYTSQNDVYANYVFNYQDDLKGIKQINDFAEKDIEASKKVKDSITRHIQTLSNEEAEKYLTGQSLPTSAKNITFYRTLGSFEGEPGQENLIIEYELDENNSKIKDLNIPEESSIGSSSIILKTEKQNPEKSIIKLNGSGLLMQEMRLLKGEIDKVGYHKESENFTYEIIDERGRTLLFFLFEQKGKYFKIDFNTK